ncbi:MAG: phosphopantetheinyl transferase [Flammeovirgaceae bacterium]|jgi:phosphopantetheinyl transferase
MPLEKIIKVSGSCLLGLWKIEEEENELLNLWEMATNDYFQSINVAEKRKEWLASRVLIKQLVNCSEQKFEGICKDSHQKPHLINSKAHISLSHTSGWASAILDLKKPTGIDIEKRSERVGRIAPKFLNEQEKLATKDDLDEIMIYWCAKEALYKLNGKKGLAFKEQILVRKEFAKNTFEGEIIQDGVAKSIQMNTIRKHDFILVHSL